MKEDYEAHAQAHLASIKRDMRKTMEDATVRAVHKVMAEFEAKSDERLMENAKGYFERINLVQTGVGIGKPEQEPITGGDERRHIICLCPDCTKPAQPQQEPVTYWDLSENEMPIRPRLYDPEEHPNHVPLYTTPPAPPQQEPVGCIPSHWVDKAKQIADGPIAYPNAERAQQAIALIKILLKSTPPARKPLTHEQRVDLLAKFEPHKHEWHAPAILIDMVEAAHGITGENT